MIKELTQVGDIWLKSLQDKRFSEELATRSLDLAKRQRDIEVSCNPGTIEAEIQSGRRMRYRVEITAPILPAEIWKKVLSLIAQNPSEVSKMLSDTNLGKIPESFTEQTGMFNSFSSHTSSCTCPNNSTLCNHILATIGQAVIIFNENFFEFLLTKGKSRKQIQNFFHNDGSADYKYFCGLDELSSRMLDDVPAKLQTSSQFINFSWVKKPPANSPFDIEELHQVALAASQRADKLIEE